MIVAAVDTASDRLSVAVGEPGGRTAVRDLAGARQHTGQLIALVDQALGELGASLAEVGALAISDGPGSFTGLRVAAAWAKGLARARGLPLWTASTLLVRAHPHLAPGKMVAAAGSAQRGDLYVAVYRANPTGAIETVVTPAVFAAGMDPATIGAPDLVVADLDPATLTAWPWPLEVPVLRGSPNAGDLIALIGRAGGASEIQDVPWWEPDYGRLAEAQVKWERAHGRPLDSARDGR